MDHSRLTRLSITVRTLRIGTTHTQIMSLAAKLKINIKKLKKIKIIIKYFQEFINKNKAIIINELQVMKIEAK